MKCDYVDRHGECEEEAMWRCLGRDIDIVLSLRCTDHVRLWKGPIEPMTWVENKEETIP